MRADAGGDGGEVGGAAGGAVVVCLGLGCGHVGALLGSRRGAGCPPIYIYIISWALSRVKPEIVTRCYKPPWGRPWAGGAAAADIARRARGARTGKGDALPWVAGGGRGGGSRAAGGARRFTWNDVSREAVTLDVSRRFTSRGFTTFHEPTFHVEP